MVKKAKPTAKAKNRSLPVATAKAKTPPATTTATISVVEAAKRLGIGRNQAYEAAHRGRLPVITIGKRLLVPTAAFNRMLGEIA